MNMNIALKIRNKISVPSKPKNIESLILLSLKGQHIPKIYIDIKWVSLIFGWSVSVWVLDQTIAWKMD